MHRRVFLMFSVAVLFSVFLAEDNIPENHPWYGPKNCTTYQCNSTAENGLTLEECTKKHGADRVLFFPTGSYCNCSVCMKNLVKGEDCSDLLIADRPAYVRCGANLTCSIASQKCE